MKQAMKYRFHRAVKSRLLGLYSKAILESYKEVGATKGCCSIPGTPA